MTLKPPSPVLMMDNTYHLPWNTKGKINAKEARKKARRVRQGALWQKKKYLFWRKVAFKGIAQRILRKIETRLIPYVLVNWRPAHFSFWILKGHHHKKSIKPFSAA
jgi:hypothetical protein